MTDSSPSSCSSNPELLATSFKELRTNKPNPGAAFIAVLEQIPGFNLAQGVRERISKTVEVSRDIDAAHRTVLLLAKATIFGDMYPPGQMGAVHLTPSERADKFKVEIGISYPIPLQMARQRMSVAFHVQEGVLTHGYLDVSGLQKGFYFEPQGVGHEITRVDEERSKNILFSPELEGKQILLPQVIHAFTTPGTLPGLYDSDFQQKMEAIILAQ